jgi:hypothetical protein
LGYLALTTDPTAFPFAQTAPNAELLTHIDGVVQTLTPHLACSADGLCLPGGCAPLGEEQIGVGATAVGVVLPGKLTMGKSFDELALHQDLLTTV